MLGKEYVMKKGQIYVRAITPDGELGNVDVLELDDDSFRVFIIDKFVRAGAVVAMKEEMIKGDNIELHADPARYTGENDE